MLIAACFHAQERLTALVTLRFIERLCQMCIRDRLAAGGEAGRSIGNEENNNYNRREHRENVFVIPEADVYKRQAY